MKSKKSLNFRERDLGFILAFIPVLGCLLFILVPMICSVFMSFMNIKGYSLDGSSFSGLSNFRFVITDERFYKALLNTFYALIALPISMVISLLLATLMRKIVHLKNFFNSVLFLPYVCSIVAVSAMWKWVFEDNYGIINSLFQQIGLHKIGFLSDSLYFMPTMIFMNIWSGCGFNIILFTAALCNIDRSYYEAAEIDGAGTFSEFFKITLPMISPTTFFILVLGLIGGLQDFTRFQIMGGDSGGPGESGLTVVLYLWQMGMKYVTSYGMGYASAVAWILALIIVAITVLNFKLQKHWVHYDK